MKKLVIGMAAAFAASAAWAVPGNTVALSVGANGFGQLGSGMTSPQTTFGFVPELVNVSLIAAGTSHAMALMQDGTVRACGSGYSGQTGLGTHSNVLTFTAISGLSNVVQVTAGWQNSYFRLGDGTVMAAGNGSYGELGNGGTNRSESTVPVPVAGLSNVVELAGLLNSSVEFARLQNGEVVGWGAGFANQLGLGTNLYTNAATAIPAISGAVQVACNQFTSYALMPDGTVKSCGGSYDNGGATGLGDLALTTNVNEFTTIPGLTNVVALYPFSYAIIVKLGDGTFAGWGSAAGTGLFALGVPQYGPITTPTNIPSLTGMFTLYPGSYHAFARKNDFTFWGWGDNHAGALGLPVLTNFFLPQPLPYPNAIRFPAGHGYSFIINRVVFKTTPGDYNGDGTSDFAVYEKIPGLWSIAFIGGGGTNQQWGNQYMTPVPADYDGDDTCDIAVFDPAPCRWYIRASTGGSIIQQWGGPGDQPVQSDYDGDGKTDIAVFRKSTSTWFIRRSSDGSLLQQQYGAINDKPVPADYDGDGKTDFAVFRPSTGTWFIRYSSGGNATRQWGNSTMKLVPGDYDGDGLHDIGVFNPVDLRFYVRGSSGGTGITSPVFAGTPVLSDYNGDRRADPTIFAAGKFHVFPFGVFPWGSATAIVATPRP